MLCLAPDLVSLMDTIPNNGRTWVAMVEAAPVFTCGPSTESLSRWPHHLDELYILEGYSKNTLSGDCLRVDVADPFWKTI